MQNMSIISIMKKQHVLLSKADKNRLQDIIQKGEAKAKKFKRALALLELDKGKTFQDVSQIVGTTVQTVSKWAKKYSQDGLTLLTDKKRSGRPPIIDSLAEASITSLACSEPPEGYERWTLRLLAEKAVTLEHIDAISKSEVDRILKKTNYSLTERGNGSFQK